MVKASLQVVLACALLIALGAATGYAQTTSQPQSADRPITFHKDIEPILQRSCQRCHNPESIAPMSLITYEQARPFARAMKQRTALARAPWSRGAMPPWFLEKSIGIQQMKDDVSLSDAEITMIGKWADAGAPRGNPADAPPPLKLANVGEWTLGPPDLVVESPKIYVSAVASDWSGGMGKTPLGIGVDRYAKSVEYMEVRDIKMGKATMNLNNRWVFHHAVTSISGPDAVVEEGEEAGEDNRAQGSLPIHEVGRNGDVFPDDAGKLLPGGGYFNWNDMHIHSSGLPGSESYARMTVGLRMHPDGYKPKRNIRGFQFGRSQLQVDAGKSNNRDDAYFVAPAHMKFWNYEPHMHANGVRMCLQAIYGRAVETLNCSGYDHNWVRNYIYEENFQPLIPKGTVLHAIAWFDASSRNGNIPDPRNTATFGNGSLGNMFIVFNLAEFLSDEEYVEEVKKRKEFIKANPQIEHLGCPACYLPTPDPAPKKPVNADQTN
jgi:hypothetical protein